MSTPDTHRLQLGPDPKPGAFGAQLGHPLDEQSENAQLDVGHHSALQPVVDGTKKKLHALEIAKAPLNDEKTLVGVSRIRWRQAIVIGEQNPLSIQLGRLADGRSIDP